MLEWVLEWVLGWVQVLGREWVLEWILGVPVKGLGKVLVMSRG